MNARLASQVLILCLFASALPLRGEQPVGSTDSVLAAESVAGSEAPADPSAEADATAAKDPAVAKTPVWARTGDDGTMIATAERWYLEEFDRRGRPETATLWVGGEVAEKTSWFYRGDSQTPERRLVTSKAGTRETEYDGKGNESRVIVADAEGTVTSTLQSVYGESGNLLRTTLERAGAATLTEYEYDDAGLLLSKRTLVNGALLLLCEYSGGAEENRTETVYSNGKAVLSVKYRDGVRVRDGDEKKQ